MVTRLPSFVRGRFYGRSPFVRVRMEFLRDGRPPDSLSSLWAAFTPTVHINALYNEIIHGKEEHGTCNTIPLTDEVNGTRSCVYAWIVDTA